jgi:hypothetical protein
MAVDTRQKRFAMMNLNRFPPTNMFEADGTIDSDDMYHLLALYTGFVSTFTACAQSLTTLMEARGLGLNSLLTTSLGLQAAITATQGLTTSFHTTKGVTATIEATQGVNAGVCD